MTSSGEVEISVQGGFKTYAPPERATAHLVVRFRSAERVRTQELTSQTTAQVLATLRSLHHPDRGPITWWSSGQLHTWSESPWNTEGRQLPLVHHATVQIDAKFKDFDALRRWVGEVTELDGVGLNGITWALTEKRLAELTTHARSSAVREAQVKAQCYADALDLGQVRPRAIADIGLLSSGQPEQATFSRRLATSAAAAESSPEIDLNPGDVEISAEVDARFVVQQRTSSMGQPRIPLDNIGDTLDLLEGDAHR